MKDNLTLWRQVEKTDPAFTKGFTGKGGFRGTAVCAQWQRYKATELWGSYGSKWGVKNEVFSVLSTDDKHDSVLVYNAVFYYPDGEFPICSDIDMWNYSNTYKSWSKNNDIHKKVSTDALTKGLSMLGFSADVFMGKFDDNKYVNSLKEEYKKPIDTVNEVFPSSVEVTPTWFKSEMSKPKVGPNKKKVWNKYWKLVKPMCNEDELKEFKKISDELFSV